MSGLPHFGQKFFDGLRRFSALITSRMLINDSVSGFYPAMQLLLKFNVLFWVSNLHQILADPLTMVSLKKYLTILC